MATARLGCSVDVIAMLLASRKTSKNKVYSMTWKGFSRMVFRMGFGQGYPGFLIPRATERFVYQYPKTSDCDNFCNKGYKRKGYF